MNTSMNWTYLNSAKERRAMAYEHGLDFACTYLIEQVID